MEKREAAVHCTQYRIQCGPGWSKMNSNSADPFRLLRLSLLKQPLPLTTWSPQFSRRKCRRSISLTSSSAQDCATVCTLHSGHGAPTRGFTLKPQPHARGQSILPIQRSPITKRPVGSFWPRGSWKCRDLQCMEPKGLDTGCTYVLPG